MTKKQKKNIIIGVAILVVIVLLVLLFGRSETEKETGVRDNAREEVLENIQAEMDLSSMEAELQALGGEDAEPIVQTVEKSGIAATDPFLTDAESDWIVVTYEADTILEILVNPNTETVVRSRSYRAQNQ